MGRSIERLKPHVRALRREMVGNLRESAASRTIARAEQLADSAESEHVRNDANKWIASLDPDTSPITRSESTINHKGLGPGLTIVFAQPETAALPVIDGTAQEVAFVSREKHLSAPIPHPAQVLSREKHGALPVPHPARTQRGQADGE